SADCCQRGRGRGQRIQSSRGTEGQCGGQADHRGIRQHRNHSPEQETTTGLQRPGRSFRIWKVPRRHRAQGGRRAPRTKRREELTMRTVDKYLTRTENFLAGGALIAATALAVFAVILRNITGDVLFWSEEATIYLIIFSTF